MGCDNVAHVVHARLGALGHESGCINRTDRENLAGQSGVLDLDDLIAAAEQHAVLTNDGAAADGRDTNLVCRTLFAALVTVVNVLRVLGECARNCVSQHQSRA